MKCWNQFCSVHVNLLFRNNSSTQEELKENAELVQTDQSEEEEEIVQTVEEIITAEQQDEETETSPGTRKKTLSETSQVFSIQFFEKPVRSHKFFKIQFFENLWDLTSF